MKISEQSNRQANEIVYSFRENESLDHQSIQDTQYQTINKDIQNETTDEFCEDSGQSISTVLTINR